ncbi:hypothetical protein MTYM_02078 [Methylococcales bacterium]|nr:hypothetical protein MTYM_02078 [Methylococcales bacterium]
MTIHSYSSGTGFSTPRVVGTGLVALDVLLQGENCPSDSALGGTTGNVLAILAFLGWSVVPVARLGKDMAGQRIKSEFAALNADTRFITQEDSTATPVVYQWPGENGKTHKFSFSCPFCGSKRSFVPGNDTIYCMHVLEHVDTTDVFYFDRVTPWALVLAETYRRRGALVMFEPSAVDADSAAFQQAIRCCNILKYADDRIVQLRSFDRHMVDVEVQTLGADGLLFRLPSSEDLRWRKLDALRISNIADTAGAGDWCTAGLLYYLGAKPIKGDMTVARLVKGLRYGQTLAALNCMHPGARGLARLIDEHMVKNKLIQLFNEELFNSNCSSSWAPAHSSFLELSRAGSIKQVVTHPNRSKECSLHLCCGPLTN